jgi:POT family proton-dependent oligopeptide transporter
MAEYRTVPDPNLTTMPKGIPYIIGNELAERFSFYGMKGILTVFMTHHLLNAAGQPDFMSDERAKTVYHTFTAAAYFFPLIGSFIADVFLGKYATILFLSLLYCVGHACLAMMDAGPFTGMSMKPWLYAGLIFIAMGAGAIKPCVSAHVGDQFGKGNQHRLSRMFSWFYFSINVGAATSTLLTPIFLNEIGPWLAFGTPGVLMAIATFVFWLGRHKFIHVPPSGFARFKEETFSPEGKRALLHLSPIFIIFIPMFWALFDQTGSAWVLQAEHMDRHFLGIKWLQSQIQAANPLLILILIPVFNYGVYPVVDKVWKMTPLRKMSVGMFATVIAFSLSSWIQMRIDGGATPSIAWQLLAYVLITAAEVMVSITSLEFAYTQAPKRMKSFLMGIYFLGVSLGNAFTAVINKIIEIPAVTEIVNGEEVVVKEASSRLEGADYYWFFTGLMLVVAIAFIFMAKKYKGQTYIQGQEGGFEATNLDDHVCASCGRKLDGMTDEVCPYCGAKREEAAEAEAEGPDAR